ncbi:hypothetical protein JTB14_034093 [Gonioctena quinquepunctata]|nr:hypothetical protein JTB14_034093 [Gonioctena quinquepunctata]
MEQAIEAAENGMCIRTASTTLNVPRMALKWRIIKRRAGITTQPLRSLGSFHCAFTEDQEAELLRYIFDMVTLSVKAPSPESTSVAHARGFNKVVVNTFYGLLKVESIDKQLPAHRIFNVDETSVSTFPGHNSKIVTLRGRKQVSRIT